MLKAGPDYPALDQTPDEVRYAFGADRMIWDGGHIWHFRARATDEAEKAVPRGRVTGDSSAVNDAQFLRPMPDDFDLWARLGNPHCSAGQPESDRHRHIGDGGGLCKRRLAARPPRRDSRYRLAPKTVTQSDPAMPGQACPSGQRQGLSIYRGTAIPSSCSWKPSNGGSKRSSKRHWQTSLSSGYE